MKYTTVLASLLALASASPVKHAKRQVPQEQSHLIYLQIVQEFLILDNPLGILDPVFGLLGNAAAAEGLTDPDAINLDCLKQLTADQAFTNAKAIGDVRGMAAALVYQALERNTGSVGLESVICPEEAVNPEIAAFDQHQDAAAEGAQEGNKVVTLELARQLALIGVNPLLALESGTFAPGDVNDATGAGNSCDTADDLPGCIFTERLLVLDVSPQEVLVAVEDIVPTLTGTGVIEPTNIDFNGLPIAGGGVATTDDAVAIATASCSVVTRTIANTAAGTIAAAASTTLSSPAATSDPTATAAGANIQSFTGTLGGPPPPVVSSTGDRPFSVNGNTFTGQAAALSRSCDIQHNACADAANSGSLSGGVSQCETQLSDCRAGNALRKRQVGAFGSCADPRIEFGAGFDGRREESFRPVSAADFDHGSAQGVGIIAGFICGRLESACAAGEETVAACEEARVAAEGAEGQAAADAFNEVLTGDVGAGEGEVSAEVETPVVGSEATATVKSSVVLITQCS